MKKRFKLIEENRHPDRVVEAIKYEIRKYIKREKRKPLPEDVDFWKFECKFAKDDEEPYLIEFVDITKNIDEAANLKCESFYIEILSTKGIKALKPKESSEEEEL